MGKTLNSQEYRILLEQLYQLRVISEMRQQDLAEALGVHQSFISKVESGERRIDVIELRKICRCLNADFVDFITELEQRLNES